MAENEKQVQTYEETEPIEVVGRAGISLGMYALSWGIVALIALLGFAIYQVRQYIPYLGYLALVAAGVVIVCLAIAPVIFLVRWFFRADFHEITEHGIVFRNLIGRVQAVSPQSAADVKISQDKKSKPEKQLPPMLSLFDLIEQGIIAPGNQTVVHGYELDGVNLAIGERLPTRLIAGKGRSGKTRRAIFDLAQDLIAGARVTVCDPHGAGGKKDALVKMLAPLAAWVTFAVTEAEMTRATSEHIEEMRRRLDKKSEEIAGVDEEGNNVYIPRVLYYDEWSSLMTRHGEDFAALLIACLEDCSREFGGVQGYATIIGHTWTAKECGGTVIRRCIHDLFIHNLSPEYARFLLPGKTRIANRADELPQKNCLFKPGNSGAKVREIITPFVENGAPGKLAEIMNALYPIESELQKELPTFADGLNKPKTERGYSYEEGYRQRDTPTGPLREQMAYLPQIASTSTSTGQREGVERENVIYLSEARAEAHTEALPGSSQPEMNKDIYKAALRDIAKRLKSGEPANEIRKSLEVNGGRALQEINQALEVLEASEHENSKAESEG